jgi:hypothetical protein
MFSSPLEPGPRRTVMSDISTNIFSILQSAYQPATQVSIPPGSKFAPVNPATFQGTWSGTDSNGKPVTLTISNISGYRANARFQTADGGLQTSRIYINTQGVFRMGNSQMTFTGSGKMTINTVITDPTTGNQSMETDHVTLQSNSSSTSSSSTTSGGGIIA